MDLSRRRLLTTTSGLIVPAAVGLVFPAPAIIARPEHEFDDPIDDSRPIGDNSGAHGGPLPEQEEGSILGFVGDLLGAAWGVVEGVVQSLAGIVGGLLFGAPMEDVAMEFFNLKTPPVWPDDYGLPMEIDRKMMREIVPYDLFKRTYPDEDEVRLPDGSIIVGSTTIASANFGTVGRLMYRGGKATDKQRLIINRIAPTVNAGRGIGLFRNSSTTANVMGRKQIEVNGLANLMAKMTPSAHQRAALGLLYRDTRPDRRDEFVHHLGYLVSGFTRTTLTSAKTYVAARMGEYRSEYDAHRAAARKRFAAVKYNTATHRIT